MDLAEIGTAVVICAYFFRHMTSVYSLNVSDPIEGQPVQLSYYLCVFGCGLFFWLLVLLWTKLHDSGGLGIHKAAKLAKLIAPITTLNLLGCLLVPFMKLPLLVRFLVLFQVSSALALLLICAFLSPLPPLPEPVRMLEKVLKWLRNFYFQLCRFEGSEEGSVSGHGSGASGSGGGSEGGDRGRDEGGAGPECGGRGTNRKQAFEIINMSLTLFAQTSVTFMGFNLIPTPSSSSKALLVVALMDQWVAYFCGLASILLLCSNKPAAKIFADIGFVCTALGFILMVPIYAACYLVGLNFFLIFFPIFFLIFFLIFFRKELKTRATEKLLPKGDGESLATWRSSCFERAGEGSVARNKATRVAVHNVDGVGGKVDEAGGSRSGHGSGASGSEENRGSYGGNDGGGGAGGGGDRGASGSGHGSGASASGGGSEDGGGDRGASGSGQGSGASGGGGGGWDGGGADPECGGRGTSKEPAFESSEIIKMSIALTAQTTGTLMGFHVIPTPSPSSKVLLVVALMDQLVAYLCGVTGILLSSNKPEDSKAAKTFAFIGFVCYTLGYILMIGMYVVMYVPWYSVLIVVLLFGVIWLILFRNGLKTRATKVWNYLKNSGNL